MQGKHEKSPRRPGVGTVIFTVLYFLGIAAFFVGLHFAVEFLEGWLTDYEAAQPNVKCSQVFEQVFAQPDWEEIYWQAGCQDTRYESASHYAAYMKDKQGAEPLRYHETSAGLSNDKKYIVTLGEEKVASFTLTSHQTEENAIPDWELGTVAVFFTRQQAVTVLTEPDCTVYINGVALSDEHTVRTLHTEAENYLPEGMHGLRQRWQRIDGLLVRPEVTAVDAHGQSVELVYDEEAGLYRQVTETAQLTREQTDTVVNAAKTYCRFMIRQETGGQLGKVFDKESEIYRTVVGRTSWSHEFKSYSFTEPELHGFYQYSDSLYSVMLKMSMHVVSPWDSVKEYPLEATFFLELQEDGKWLVTNMTNVDVQKATTLVRLTYISDGQTLRTEMVDAAATMLTPPGVTVPEGKIFTGWYRMQTDGEGQITYSLAFLPGEDGTVSLPGDPPLESMVLYALFR